MKNIKAEIKGKKVKCSHCGGEEFQSSYRLLNTRFLTFFRLDWLNRDANAFECLNCGHIEWFVDVDDFGKLNDSYKEMIKCPSCGKDISKDDTKCLSCGWTYEDQPKE